MSTTTYTITLSTCDAPHPLSGETCFAGRCDKPATRVTFGGSAAYCEQHGGESSALIPATQLRHVVELDDGTRFEGWTLAQALERFSAHVERVTA
jgi:hypothetical protein